MAAPSPARATGRRRRAVAPLPLAPDLNLTAAAALREALLARQGADCVLAAAAVRRLGGACLQVLLAARADWAASGHTLTLASPSPAFRAAADAMAASAALGLPPGPAAP